MKKFHISDILSITTGKMVSINHMDGIYNILNYMTDDNLFTHQLPRVWEECAPFLLEQFPQLKDVDSNNINPDNWQEWLAEQIKKFGEILEVPSLPKEKHKYIDPVTEIYMTKEIVND